MVILLFGPPGCGKGTQSPLITNLLGIPSISTGEMLRAEVNAGTALGKIASGLLAEGKLVSDDMVNQMLVNRIDQEDCKDGFQLDGYPRTVTQAKYLDERLDERGLDAPFVFYFTAKDSVLIERITSRRQCPTCGRIYNILFKPPVKRGICDFDGTPLERRKDDKAEVVKERLLAYKQLTAPVVDHYKSGRLYHLNADRPPAEIFRDIENVLRPTVKVLTRVPVKA